MPRACNLSTPWSMQDCWHFGQKPCSRWTPCGTSRIYPQPHNWVCRAEENAEVKIAVVGTGGVGGYFGGRLAAAGNAVTFVARGARLEAIQRSGLTIRSSRGDFRTCSRERAEN